MRKRIPPLVLMAAGFGIWASAFVVLYSAASLGCELGWNQISLGPISALRTILIAIWLIHVAALTGLLWYCARAARDNDPHDRFVHRAAMYLTGAAIAAIVWLAIALLVPSACA